MKGSDKAIRYDETVYKITVTLEDNGDGTITAEADKTKEELRFVNTAGNNIEGNKTDSNKTGGNETDSNKTGGNKTGSNKTDAVKTGDETPLEPLFGALMISAFVLAVLLAGRLRRMKQR